ncbi:MAG TPA: FxLYD domain-containing protein [Candidatus Bathyarchaeia archaeon]|nr:FxLYD domain-containing protein [Candidatus Bathyarchaeia archaeon]
MTALRLLMVASILALTTVAEAQTSYTPQSSSRLTVSFTTDKIGGGRVLVYGEVRNGANAACDHVIISVEGLDENGRVVSRGRAYVYGVVAGRGSAPFELKLASPGTEKRYRVEIESFQYVMTGN